jgi:hypothetical protein
MTIRSSAWLFGIVAGASTSAVVSLVIVTWEWLENPGGIFHNADGTNWKFVVETAVSWLVPTFIYVAVLAAILHLGWSAWRRRLGK